VSDGAHLCLKNTPSAIAWTHSARGNCHTQQDG